MTTAVLLVNTGSPLSYDPKDVEAYLTEFLLDRRILELPWLLRQIIVRGLIVPLRVKKIAKSYQEIWKEKAPLIENAEKLSSLLQDALGKDFHVVYSMRYQEPSIVHVMKDLEKKNISDLCIVPLFPQYTSETSGSIFEKVLQEISRWKKIPTVTSATSFSDHPLFIDAWIQQIQKYDLSSYDHILFSFHGLPERNVLLHRKNCLQDGCCFPKRSENSHCYKAQCHATCQSIVEKMQIPKERYSIAFQSRLGPQRWLKPYTIEKTKELAQKGYKKLLVVCPAFVADCLETVYEIGFELKNEFIKEGGCTLDLVEGLNASPSWVQALQTIVLEKVCSKDQYKTS